MLTAGGEFNVKCCKSPKKAQKTQKIEFSGKFNKIRTKREVYNKTTKKQAKQHEKNKKRLEAENTNPDFKSGRSRLNDCEQKAKVGL